MKKVAIVSAMEEETSYIQQYLENRSGWEEIEKNIYQNKAIGTKVYVKVLGIGKVNAAFQTADVIHELHPDLIVNIGVSGGLSKKVRRGTIAIGKNYVQTDMRPFLKANYPKINDTPDEIVEGLERVSKENGFDYIVGKLATVTGVGEYLKEQNPDVKVVAVEPASSPVLSKGIPGAHKIQGIGAGFVPEVLNTKIYDEVIAIENEDAFEEGRLFALSEGVLVGISSGAALKAAKILAERPENKGKNIVVLLPDSGDRYLSTPLFAD